MSYTSEKNTQIILGLLKHHNIKKIIASPGANNVSFVASVQADPFFEVYSCVDERSAAYIACGMAAETNEPVVITCTGATASRNYFSGLTEAYYRHLPVIAITYTQPTSRIGHKVPQIIDRTVVSNDIAKISFRIPMVKDKADEWECNIKTNIAILEMLHDEPGPVHLNVETTQSGTFSETALPLVYPVDKVYFQDEFPSIEGKVAIFVGTHKVWNNKLTEAVEEFCEKYNAVVFGDLSSNYKGKYFCNCSIISTQYYLECNHLKPDILIHIGDISGSYIDINPKSVWIISKSGTIYDFYKKLRYCFEMSELDFFEKMNSIKPVDGLKKMDYYDNCINEKNEINNKIKDIPFSNIWVAKQLSARLPKNSVLHLGILNTLRSWNFFDIDKSISVYVNTGGFGIDGCVSSMLGASLVNNDKIFYGIVGDLAFFYDLNSLGNRHVPKNFRLMVINNGIGQEFKNYRHRAAQFKENTDPFIAAKGHFGNKSEVLIRHYAEDLGFEYLSAKNKENFKKNMDKFLSPKIGEKPIIFEVFTNSEDETEALKIVSTISKTSVIEIKNKMRDIIGADGLDKIKKIIKK